MADYKLTQTAHKVRFAVIGVGRIGMRHIEMIKANPQAELVAICDVRPLETLGVETDATYYDNHLELLEQEHNHLDVVNIATPNGLHAVQALDVLQHKCHVVIEKPLALTKRDAEKVLHKAMQVNRHVFGVMQNRYSPPSQWLKSLVDDNALGRIAMVNIDCFWNRDERYYTLDSWHGTKDLDGGTLFTQFSHFIDIMYWLFGDITNIKSQFMDFNHQSTTDFEDSGIIQFEFTEGGLGSFIFSTSVDDQNFESTLTIIGEKGTVKVGGQYMEKVEYCHIRNYEMPVLPATNPGNDYGYYKGSAANHHFVIDNVVDVLTNGGSITTNALEGMKVVEMIERMYAACGDFIGNDQVIIGKGQKLALNE